MKHLFAMILVLVTVGTSWATVPTTEQMAEQMALDKLRLTQEFDALSQLETTVKAGNLTYADLDDKTIEALSLMEDVESSLMAVAGAGDTPLGIPGFWWGLCLSWVGILLVYLLMEDSPDRKEQVKKAVIGALVGIGVWLLFWLVVWGSIFATVR